MTFENFHKAELKGWHDRAAGYSTATGLATLQIVPALLEALRLRAGYRLLDLATGPGYVAGAAAALQLDSTGIDFAPGMISTAQSLYPDVDFQVADLHELPFADNSFDAVSCNIGLFHVTDPDRALREAARVLCKGKCFAFSQWCGPATSELYEAILGVLKEHADMTLADPAPDAYRLSDPKEVEAMMISAGFDEFKVRNLPTVLIAQGDDFFEFFMRFGVRVPLIVAAQSAAVQAAIRLGINDVMAKYKTPTGFEVPMPSLLYSGVAL